jgi:hypothetical protein
MNRLEQGSFALHFNGKRLEPVSLEKNIVGFCSKCEGELESVAYHRSDDDWLVSACCHDNTHLFLIHFDRDWNWLGDLELAIAPEFKSISSLPKEKLEAVFTPAELRTLEACEQGKPYTRQNLYRARAKYEKFEKLFGLKINL